LKHLPVLALLLLLTARDSRAAPPPAGNVATKPGSVFHVPYRLADTKHLLVRAKLNGKGPYNFILDTGAPALFVSAEIADKIGVKPAADGWGVFDRLEVEGGATLEKIQGRIESPAQLKGMNAMGLAGVHIDGVFGFNLLANFRIEIDLTQPKMTWTRQRGLILIPLNAKEITTAKAVPTEGMAQMESLTKMASSLFAQKTPLEPVPRGFFGIEFAVGKADAVQVTAVLADSPAAKAGVSVGDRITALAVGDDPVADLQGTADLLKRAATVAAGTTVHFTVQRDGKKIVLPVVAGQGGL
jgi:hypothetical protein